MIDAQLAAFLEEGIFIDLATRNERLEPHGARGVAAAVDEDGTRLVVFLTTAAADVLRPDLESNGQVAISFARPPDERACQIKGRFVGARPANDAEKPAVQRQCEGRQARVASIGFERAIYEHWPWWPCVAIRVHVEAIFNQTPGPGTGAPLR